MAQLENCSNCNDIYVKNQFRDVCPKCHKVEEQAYDTVASFLRKRENRAATMIQVEEATGIEEQLILKFIHSGRLKLTQFPNLGYPCEKCGTIIRTGKLCEPCSLELKKELELLQYEEERKAEILKRDKGTYFSR